MSSRTRASRPVLWAMAAIALSLISPSATSAICPRGCPANSFCQGDQCVTSIPNPCAGCTPPNECINNICLHVPPNNCPTGETPCPSGFATNRTCVNLSNNPNFCGDCFIQCTEGASCSKGVCTCTSGNCTTCPPGKADCNNNNVCIDLAGNNYHCGMCNNACLSPMNGVNGCFNGKCTLTCDKGYCPNGSGQCNSANTQTDPNNCGTCGNVCSGGQTCQGGACSCPSGTSQCGNSCVNESNDPNNCGACGNACSNGNTCQGGKCACPAGQTSCGGTCVDTKSDPKNCKSCGNVCSAPSHGTSTGCSNGTCTWSCNSGSMDCNGSSCSQCPTPPASAHVACTNGYCGWLCNNGYKNCPGNSCTPEGQTCGGCSSSETDCNGVCKDLKTDPNNCGGCGVYCGAGFTCTNGICTSTSSPTPFKCTNDPTDCNSPCPDNCNQCTSGTNNSYCTGQNFTYACYCQ